LFECSEGQALHGPVRIPHASLFFDSASRVCREERWLDPGVDTEAHLQRLLEITAAFYDIPPAPRPARNEPVR
jgi:hypothetical protein